MFGPEGRYVHKIETWCSTSGRMNAGSPSVTMYTMLKGFVRINNVMIFSFFAEKSEKKIANFDSRQRQTFKQN
jgi:hypothetical protein